MRRLWVAIFLMGTLLSPLSTRADGEQVVLFDYVRAEAYTEIKSGNCKASKLTIDAIEESYLDGPTGKVTLHRGIYVWVYNTCNGGNIELYAQKKFYEEDFWHTSHLRSTNLLVDKVKVCEHGQCMFVSLDLRLKADKKSPLKNS